MAEKKFSPIYTPVKARAALTEIFKPLSDWAVGRRQESDLGWKPRGVPSVLLDEDPVEFDADGNELPRHLLAGRFESSWFVEDPMGWPADVADYYCIYAVRQTVQTVHLRSKGTSGKPPPAALTKKSIGRWALAGMTEMESWIASVYGEMLALGEVGTMVDAVNPLRFFLADLSRLVLDGGVRATPLVRDGRGNLVNPSKSEKHHVPLRLSRQELALVLIGLEIPDIASCLSELSKEYLFENVLKRVESHLVDEKSPL